MQLTADTDETSGGGPVRLHVIGVANYYAVRLERRGVACCLVTMAGRSQQASVYHEEKESGGENG